MPNLKALPQYSICYSQVRTHRQNDGIVAKLCILQLNILGSNIKHRFDVFVSLRS